MASPEELANLLLRCAQGDQRAFEHLYRASSAQLFGLIRRVISDPDLASEALQESYIKIWTHAGEYCPHKATPLVWMKIIARNKAIDLIRRSGKQQPVAIDMELLHRLPDTGAEPEEDAVRTQQERDLLDGLYCLSESQREAILLIYYQGLTHQELAHHLNKPLGTVKSWVRRGLVQLKSHFDSLDIENKIPNPTAAESGPMASRKKAPATRYPRFLEAK